MSTETANADAANAVADSIKPATQTADDPNKEPSELPLWVQKRVEQGKRSGAKDAEAVARKAILAELGIDNLDSVKKLAAEEKKRAEERKSLEQKAADRDVENANLKRERDEYRESTTIFATEQLATLSESQKDAVLSLAGDDPAKQLKAIATLRPTWSTTAPIVAPQVPNAALPIAAPGTAPAVPSAKPAQATGPAPNAPPSAGTHVVQNHLETYEWLYQHKPFAASTYFQVHYEEINEARSKRSN